MMRLLEMLCPMLIGRRVAAAYVAASEAQSKVDPRGADLLAFFATLGVSFDVLVDALDVRALDLFPFHDVPASLG